MNTKSPPEISVTMLEIGTAKSRLTFASMILMGFLAGTYIGMGGTFMLVVTQEAAQTIGVGFAKLIGGFVFSLGLFLVVTAGAELFTGNCLVLMGVLSRRITIVAMLRNLCVVYCANFVGAVFFAFMIFYSGVLSAHSAESAISIAAAKVSLSAGNMFLRGVLCNWLVCLAVWGSVGAQDIAGKFIAVFMPTSAFVAIGFEHCVANMFFMPLGFLLSSEAVLPLTISAFAKNIFFVTLGNTAGGMIFVALFYFLVFRSEFTKY